MTVDRDELGGVVDALQNSIEGNEGFPLDTELMKFLTGKLDRIRELTGVEAFKPRENGECGRCGSTPGRRDLTCPACTNPDGSDKF